MDHYGDDKLLKQLYLEDEKSLAEQQSLWGSDESDYRQRIDHIGSRRRRTWDRIRRRKAELTAMRSQ